MLKVTDNSNTFPFTEYENLCIKHKQDGMDTMTFYCNTKCKQYTLLREESSIESDGNM